jgi:hypothetical protein
VSLTFKQAEVSDVLKSLTVLDLDGGHIASVSYDSTKPVEQRLEEVALSIPDRDSLVSLLPQIKGARVAVQPTDPAERLEGTLLGVDSSERRSADGVVRVVLLSLLTDNGAVRSFDLHHLARLEVLDEALRRDLDYYLRTVLSAKKKDARTFTFFARGEGERRIRLSYTLAAPVWKATYRIILGEEDRPPTIQGWAVVDNTQDEDWEGVQLSLVAGLPVSFIHDLYTPRYIRRPVVEVQETTGVLPPEVEAGMEVMARLEEETVTDFEAPESAPAPAGGMRAMRQARAVGAGRARARSAVSSAPAQVRERKLGDLFEYQIEHPVTIRRNQSALVPIVLRAFEGRPVLLHNRDTRPENPMRCVEFKNTTGLTLEGGPVTVLEGGSYVGEAMLETLKPDEDRLIPYAVELSVRVLDNVRSQREKVSRIIIRRGTLRAQYYQVVETTYEFRNNSPSEQTVYLDHQRPGSDWQLDEPASPHETTANYWRFRFALPARATTSFVVRCRQKLADKYALSSITEEHLSLWIEQRYLDQASERVLRQALELRRQMGGVEAAIHQLEAERDAIHKEQKRIRENLQSLGDRSSEKDLRDRLVRTLNTQEDRLEQITREIKTQQAERDRMRAELDTLLGQLEYEAER